MRATKTSSELLMQHHIALVDEMKQMRANLHIIIEELAAKE